MLFNLNALDIVREDRDAPINQGYEGGYRKDNVAGFTPTQRKQKAEVMVIDALLKSQPINAQEAADITGLSKDCARKRMNDLFNRGKAIKVGSRKKSELNTVFYFSLIKGASCD